MTVDPTVLPASHDDLYCPHDELWTDPCARCGRPAEAGPGLTDDEGPAVDDDVDPTEAERRALLDQHAPNGRGAPAAGAPSHVRLTPASTVTVDRPTWVWDRRIPVGGTALMPGREGMGKTALACHVAARLTRGQLAGHRFGKPADVVYVGHEDDRATVLVPRLQAAGADLSRFLFVDMPAATSFSVGVDSDALAQACAGRDVALVIVDPLDSHLVGVDTHRKAEVQQAVQKLAELAQRLRCGALGLAHINKGDARDILTRVVGSVGFTTSVRSVLAVGEHPDNPDERVCVVAKANMTDKATVPAIRFRVEGASVPHPDGGDHIDTGVVVMLGELMGIDPNSVLPGNADERGLLTEAVDWLHSMLSTVATDRKEVVRLAREEGITDKRLRTARERLGVIAERDDGARGRPSSWALPITCPLVTCPNPGAHKGHVALPGETSAEPGVTRPFRNGHVNPGSCRSCGRPVVRAGAPLCPACTFRRPRPATGGAVALGQHRPTPPTPPTPTTGSEEP